METHLVFVSFCKTFNYHNKFKEKLEKKEREKKNKSSGIPDTITVMRNI